MRFVPVKNVEQQELVRARTAQMNQIRGANAEFGIVMFKGARLVRQQMPGILEDAEKGLPHKSRELFAQLFSHY